MRWNKSGKRSFDRYTGDYNAVIFGAPAPKQLWAWAVWDTNFTAEGIEFSLKSARMKACAAIVRSENEAKARR